MSGKRLMVSMTLLVYGSEVEEAWRSNSNCCVRIGSHITLQLVINNCLRTHSANNLRLRVREGATYHLVLKTLPPTEEGFPSRLSYFRNGAVARIFHETWTRNDRNRPEPSAGQKPAKSSIFVSWSNSLDGHRLMA